MTARDVTLRYSGLARTVWLFVLALLLHWMGFI
jgi:hypothetical protein